MSTNEMLQRGGCNRRFQSYCAENGMDLRIVSVEFKIIEHHIHAMTGLGRRLSLALLMGIITVGVPADGFSIVNLLKLHCPPHMKK